MSGERMVEIDGLLRRILPQVMPCPTSMARDTLRMLAVEFCKETGVWDVTLVEPVMACETIIEPEIPKDAAIANVTSLSLDGKRLEGGQFEVGRRDIILAEGPADEGNAVIRASLRPLRTSNRLPEDILEEYGDFLVFGTIAKLKAMSGKNIEWSDPPGASVNYQLYEDGCAKARARKFRKRFGGGILYVNTEF